MTDKLNEVEQNFLNELLQTMDDNNLSLYQVIGDVVNGNYSDYVSKETNDALESEYKRIIVY